MEIPSLVLALLFSHLQVLSLHARMSSEKNKFGAHRARSGNLLREETRRGFHYAFLDDSCSLKQTQGTMP